MKHKFLLIYSWFVRTLLFFLPDIPFIMRFRGYLYGIFMKECGKDFQVTHDTIIKGLENFIVGNNVFIGNSTIILARVDIFIDSQVLIAPHVVIVTGNHTSINGSYRYGQSNCAAVHLCYGSWVAANSTIQKGAVLPCNSVLSANSFLNKAFTEENALYGGVPAKKITKE